MKYILLFIPIIFILFSCDREKEIEFEFPPFEGEKLVILASIGPDKPIRVHLTKTFPVDVYPEPMDTHVDNELVEILENGLVVDSITESQYGSYLSSIIPSEGKTYAIRAHMDDNIAISDEVIIPQKVTISEVRWAFNEDSSYVNGHFFFQDPLDVKNYYTADEHGIHTILTDDEDFAGGTSSFDFSIPVVQVIWQHTPPIMPIDTIISDSFVVKLYTLSKEFYEYDKTSQHYSGFGNETEFQPTHALWSNITNGYGLVGAYNVDSVKIGL